MGKTKTLKTSIMQSKYFSSPSQHYQLSGLSNSFVCCLSWTFPLWSVFLDQVFLNHSPRFWCITSLEPGVLLNMVDGCPLSTWDSKELKQSRCLFLFLFKPSLFPRGFQAIYTHTHMNVFIEVWRPFQEGNIM